MKIPNNRGLKMNIACVTGATGMIGRRIVRRLLLDGYRVRALDLHLEKDSPEIEAFQGDVGNAEILRPFLRDAKLIFHCAAELRDETRMWDVNVSATKTLMSLIDNSGAEYFCHLSSAGVVGRTNVKWVDEETECRPQNTYERTKWEAEQVVAKGIEGCRIVMLRPTNVVDHQRPGPLHLPQNGSLLERLKVFVKGGECAHIVHAENVAQAAMFFVSRPVDSPGCYFVSCDHEPLNTYAGVWALYQAMKEGRPIEAVRPVLHMPLVVAYILRRLARGTGNRGDVRYSSQKLLSSGFSFPLDLRSTVHNLVHGP
jgi:nucleoside-diphosphate-sugar epimerase